MPDEQDLAYLVSSQYFSKENAPILIAVKP